MIRFALIIILSFTACYKSMAQVGLVKRSLRHLEKGDMEQAMELARKAVEKDSLSPAGFYAWSVIYMNPLNPSRNIDSAYHSIIHAQKLFDVLDEKERQKHEKVEIDNKALTHQKTIIDSAAYQRAYSLFTEEAFIYFISHFSTAPQVADAIEHRNALAFAAAKKLNTFESYREFIQKYPEAQQIAEAKKRFENLYFYEKTADGKLNSYLTFLREHPNTPYRDEAEKSIFEVVTADHSAGSYLKFINEFPNSVWRSRAVDMLYHIYKENNLTFPTSLMNDSLRRVSALEKNILIPTWEAGFYGFMDDEGKEIVPPEITQLLPQELCKGGYRDYILTKNKIVSLDLKTIYQGAFDEVNDLGYGLLKVSDAGRVGVIHKSGKVILPVKYEEVKLLNGQFLVYQMNGFWGIYTVSGRGIARPRFDEIFEAGSFYIFDRNGLLYIKTADQLLKAADNEPVSFERAFTDFELLEDGALWITSDSEEMIVDPSYKEIIPLGAHKIKMYSTGFVLKRGKDLYLLSKTYKRLNHEPATQVLANKKWFGLKMKGKWNLYETEGHQMRGERLDSVRLLGDNFALAIRNDSIAVLTKNKSHLLSGPHQITLISETHASQYLLVEESRWEKVIIHDEGAITYHGRFEEVKPLGKDYVVITQQGKKGLISQQGMTLLPFEYDAIGNYEKGYVSLLKNKRFGLYHASYRVFIPPLYEKNINPYNERIFTVSKNGKFGVVDRNNQPLSDIVYDEVQYWNDSVALVKMEGIWSAYNVNRQEIVDTNIKSIHHGTNFNGEMRVVIRKDTGYGVWSNRLGEIVPPVYNDIVNIGTNERPIYFTEKHLSEAELYVVIYYDYRGQVIRKQAFEAQDYRFIYCDN